MYNFIPCSYIFIGLLDQRCLAYKNNEKDLRVFLRRHVHGFHHQINNDPKEMVTGDNLIKYKSFLVSDDDFITVHDAENFNPMKI